MTMNAQKKHAKKYCVIAQVLRCVSVILCDAADSVKTKISAGK